jgi:glycosyltransferase involved in cell wall biosynthesis
MANTGLQILKRKYKVNPEKPRMVPHGAPDVPFVPSGNADKGEYGGHTILSTFGLISRGKGLEYAISSLPPIVAEFPEVKYLILGQTHPKVVMAEGESYRESLIKLAEELGVSEHVEFVNRYLGLRQLLRYLHLTDIYVTPYIGKEQIVSGTLAYAIACGKAIVSTPYLYATEVLGNGRGLLVDFRDAQGIAQATLGLLRDRPLKEGVEARCYAFSRDMTWRRVGWKHVSVARDVIAAREAAVAQAELASFRVPRVTTSHAS